MEWKNLFFESKIEKTRKGILYMKKISLLPPSPTERPKNAPKPTPPMLINEIARLFHNRMRSYDSEGPALRDGERLVLHVLEHFDGCNQLELVRRTHLKPPTISVTLKSLEAQGFVYRECDEKDLRVTRVYLSEQGRAHNSRIMERLLTIDGELMQGFTEEEKMQLSQYLERMRNNILPDYAKKNS